MGRQKLFVVTGISGSGKTTIAWTLLQRGEIAFDSKLNPELYQFVDAAGHVADTIRLHDDTWRIRYKWSLNDTALMKLLSEHADAERVFLCGRANLFQYWHAADKVFLLKIDAPTLHKRLNDPSRDNLFAKDAATQERLATELQAVQEKITRRGAIVVDATLPVNDVVENILGSLS